MNAAIIFLSNQISCNTGTKFSMHSEKFVPTVDQPHEGKSVHVNGHEITSKDISSVHSVSRKLNDWPKNCAMYAETNAACGSAVLRSAAANFFTECASLDRLFSRVYNILASFSDLPNCPVKYSFMWKTIILTLSIRRGKLNSQFIITRYSQDCSPWFTNLQGPEEVIKELLGSTVTRNYATIVAGDLDRYQRSAIWSHRPWTTPSITRTIAGDFEI